MGTGKRDTGDGRSGVVLDAVSEAAGTFSELSRELGRLAAATRHIPCPRVPAPPTRPMLDLSKDVPDYLREAVRLASERDSDAASARLDCAGERPSHGFHVSDGAWLVSGASDPTVLTYDPGTGRSAAVEFSFEVTVCPLSARLPRRLKARLRRLNPYWGPCSKSDWLTLWEKHGPASMRAAGYWP